MPTTPGAEGWAGEHPKLLVQFHVESELETGAFAVPSMRTPPLEWYGPFIMRSAPAHTELPTTYEYAATDGAAYLARSVEETFGASSGIPLLVTSIY